MEDASEANTHLGPRPEVLREALSKFPVELEVLEEKLGVPIDKMIRFIRNDGSKLSPRDSHELGKYLNLEILNLPNE